MFDLLVSSGIGKQTTWPNGIPGPQVLATGNDQIGYFGEVGSSEFISGSELAALCGVTGGVLVNDTVNWIKLAFNGNIQFIPKMSIRTNLSWTSLNNFGVVTPTQNKLVVIKGVTYRVRLMRGANSSPYDGAINTLNPPGSIGSEWNKLMYGLINTSATRTALEGPILADYTPTDMGLGTLSQLGACPIMQELISGTGNHVQRNNGSGAVTGLYPYSTTTTDKNRAWRPVVEYVSG